MHFFVKVLAEKKTSHLNSFKMLFAFLKYNNCNLLHHNLLHLHHKVLQSFIPKWCKHHTGILHTNTHKGIILQSV